MKLTIFHEESGNMCNIDVEDNEQVENVKALVEVELKIPLHEQVLLFHGNELSNIQDSISKFGIKENDLIVVRKKIVAPSVQGAYPTGGNTNVGGSMRGNQSSILSILTNIFMYENLNTFTPSRMQQILKQNQLLLNQIAQFDPKLHQAIVNPSANAMKPYFSRIVEEIKLKKLYERVANDPFDVEAQKLIEEQIRKQNVAENLSNALEYTPEVFGHIVMLYIDCQVNDVPLKAFVDSGAQMTIMSKSCAEKCGLLKLLDEGFSGIAQGVGTAKILGRIHLTHMKIGKTVFNVSITVLDQGGVEFLFGLDMLRRHQCQIDLKQNVLRIGDESVPFLPESQIPKHDNIANIPGTPGTPTSTNLIPMDFKPQSSSSSSLSSSSSNLNNPPHSSSTSSSNHLSETKIKQLTDLGFSRSQAVEALTICNGNTDAAASYLLNF